MAITRLGLANPAANTDTLLQTFTDPYLVSVTVANKALTATPVLKVTIWVVPPGAVIPAQYAYICSNLVVGLGQAFETFRFAVQDGDTLYVRATTVSGSFTLNGILQNDVQNSEDTIQTFTNKTIRGNYNTIYLESGLTNQRNAGAEVGYIRYNTEFSALEVKTESGWSLITAGEQGPAGTNGTNGDATLYTPAVALDWDVTPTTIAGALNELAARLRTLEP
jgi:hypothetical protein